MALPTLVSPAGAQAHNGSRGAAFISSNTRVRGAQGLLATALDQVVFSGATGTWLLGDQRVRIQGAPSISTTSTGASQAGSSSGPMLVVQGNSRIRSS